MSDAVYAGLYLAAFIAAVSAWFLGCAWLGSWRDSR